MAIKRPRGTQDFLPEQIVNWHYIEQHMREICKAYGFSEIRTPAFEDTKLFLRGIGETTDVVSKEMYTFSTGDDKEQSYTLRPENTASAVRAYLENKVYGKENLTKWFYMGSMFRHDKPQAGRYREFHQFGAEVLGSPSPVVDSEVICMIVQLLKDFGLKDLNVEVNSVGCPNCRPTYRQKLIEFFASQFLMYSGNNFVHFVNKLFPPRNDCIAILNKLEIPDVQSLHCILPVCTVF